MLIFAKFTKDESGAVTVDWVVLTAAIVGIAIAVIGLISGGVEDASTGINDELVVASAITFGGSDADWAYTAISSQHGASWNGSGVDSEGRNWVESTYDSWSGLDDAALQTQHQFNLDGLDGLNGSGTPELYTDYVAVSTQIMDERGLL